MEVWKEVLCTIGKQKKLLEVSSKGRRRMTYFKSGKVDILDYGTPRGEGYLKFSKWGYAHRIVAQMFIENTEGKEQVNHIDGVKTNNRIENLEWVTRKENAVHAVKSGLLKIPTGKDNWHTGKKRSQETRDKIGNSNRGKTLTQKTKDSISKSKKGLNNVCADKRIHIFYNIETLERVECCYFEARKNSQQLFNASESLPKRLKQGKKRMISNWIYLGVK